MISLIQGIIENSGIPTVSVSVLREITEKVTPPRVLFQDRALGHTLGDPHEAALQSRILEAALSLLKAPELPVAQDFQELEREKPSA